jgi:hypothetical protein
MAAHRPKFGQVERQMMDELFEPEVLREKIPGMGDVLDGAAHLRALHEEIGIIGKFRTANGFTADRSVQRICKIDTNILIMLDHLHEAGCMCGKPLWGSDGHKAWFYEWLEGPGKSFDTRTKVIL